MTLAEEEYKQFDRLPPYSVESEQCVLGSMFLERDCIPVVRGILQTRDAFYQPDHQILYDLLCEMYDTSRPADPVTVREELVRRKLLEEIGGTAYLAEVLHKVPSAAHHEYYAKVVREKFMWRQAIATCNEVLRAAYQAHHSENAVAEVCRQAADALSLCSVNGYDDDFRPIGEIAMEAYELAADGEQRFVPTGLTEIDRHTGGLQLRAFTQIGGRPGTGKSQTARQIAVNAARAGIAAAIISVEETRQKIGANLLAAASGVKNSSIVFGQVKGAADWDQLARGAGALSRLPLYVNDRPISLSEVIAAVTLAATKYRCRVVVVDYLQLIDPEADGNENREITIVSRTLKGAFKRLNVAGVVAVQLNRGNEAGGSPRLPELRDLRGSGSLEQDGDLIILLHREDQYHKGEPDYVNSNQIQAVIAKNKNGATGVIPLRWDGDFQTVTDWPEVYR